MIKDTLIRRTNQPVSRKSISKKTASRKTQLIQRQESEMKKIILSISKITRSTKAGNTTNMRRIIIWQGITSLDIKKYKTKTITKHPSKFKKIRCFLNQEKFIGSGNQTKNKYIQKHRQVLELKNKKMSKRIGNSFNKKMIKINKSEANKNQISRVLFNKKENRIKENPKDSNTTK